MHTNHTICDLEMTEFEMKSSTACVSESSPRSDGFVSIAVMRDTENSQEIRFNPF